MLTQILILLIQSLNKLLIYLYLLLMLLSYLLRCYNKKKIYKLLILSHIKNNY